MALATEQERQQICREKVGEKLCEKIINIAEVDEPARVPACMPTQPEVDNGFDTVGLRDVQPYLLYKISFQITDALGSSAHHHHA